MSETQRRIQAYKAALPGLRERVAAVALLLVLSITMLTSASFAWLTISRAPELSGVATTVAANGNLEIALVAKDGKKPEESKIGDSSAASEQSVIAANLTWGNLVNLSDSSYGLDNLTLRPAQLNQSALLTSPLYGAVYEQDGRITKLNSSFAYATWQPAQGETPGYFLVTNDYGIRAISSTTVEAVGFAQQVLEKRDAAESANLAAGSSYITITKNTPWMNSLAAVMGTYMTAKLNDSDPSVAKEDVINLRDMFAAFVEVYEQEKEALVAMLNYQLFLMNSSEEGNTPYTEYTVERLMSSAVTEATLKKEGLQLNGLNQFKKDYATLVSNLEVLNGLAEQASITFSSLNNVVNSLVNVGTCTLDGTTINTLAGNKSQAFGMLGGGTKTAVITNGIIYNFEKLNGTRCDIQGLELSATYIITVNIKANITTNAPVPAQFATDLEFADSLNKGAAGVKVAQDTYGLAIDLWVRTNKPNAYLTLEGNVLTQESEIEATGQDADGNIVEIYTLSRMEDVTSTDENGNTTTEKVSYTFDLYKVEAEDGTVTWYDAGNHSEVTLEEGETPARKIETVVTVIGFEGENRVWEDNSMLPADSTTQGSGSCYVYYADTPEDQARSLKLLSAFNVAFVDEKGQLMATAIMDTDRYYAESGRVTVPLVLKEDSINLGTDINNKTRLAITALEQNVAKRITAIVYLDGTKLSNQDVLAASDIQGKLNIQFGSSESLVHAEDEKLMNATLSVTASVSDSSFNYDESLESGTPMKTTVTLNIAGEEPEHVTAFFLRAISSTQGSREGVMNFTRQEDGSWAADYTFTAPGNYVLRSVMLDGSTYDLKDCPTVSIEGFTVESLSCNQATNNHVRIMTAASSSKVDLRLKFASDNVAAMPKTVQGRFLRDDGTAVNINFSYNAGGANKGYWTGTATFLSSGDYTLQYLVLDGEYTEIDSGMWQTAEVYLGMKVSVYTDSPTSFKYVPSELADNQLNLYMKVKIMDDTGGELPALSGATLYYPMQGSSIAEKGMSTPLTWNASSGYYEGAFKSKVGMYNFGSVTVGENIITYATTSPGFRIISPEPPVFNSGNTYAYQYAPDGNAVLSVLIDNCEAATVYADVINSRDGKTYQVEGRLNEGSWVFDVPKDANGKQNGVWTIQQLRLWDVYDKDGNPYTEEVPLTFDLTGTANVTAKVVSEVFASFAENKSQNFTGNGFMVPYTVSGLNVDLKDFAGEAIKLEDGTSLISDVKLTFTYSGGSSELGGYTSSELTNATDGATVTVALTDDGSGTRFVQTADAQLLYAGRYTTTLSYKVGTTTVTYSSTDKTPLNNIPVFTVSSGAPTVTVTGISPAEGSNYRLFVSSRSADGSVNPASTRIDAFRYTPYSAAVYIYAIEKSGLSDNEPYYPTLPTVTLKLDGMPSNFSATMSFDNASDSSYAVVYTFTPSALTVGKKIGGGINGEDNILSDDVMPKIFPAGKQTVSEISVVYNDLTFTVSLSHEVTINQPQYPPYLNYKVNDSTFTQSLPGTVYSQDGETITVTLPSYNTWTENKSSTTNGSFTVQSGYPSTRNVYTERSETSGCNTTTYYTPYVETTTVSKATSSTSTWVNTHAITGWKVGSTTYAPGETVTVTGSQTITAVVTVTEGPKTTNSSTTTRTEIKYTANGSETTTKPSGTKVDSATNSSNDVVS